MFTESQILDVAEKPYRLIECIGVGGQCEVWKAEQLDKQTYVAIRTVRGFYTSSNGVKTPQDAENMALLISLLNDEITILEQLDTLADRNGILPLLAHGSYQHRQWQGLDLPVMVQPYCPFSLREFVLSLPKHQVCSFVDWWTWFKQLISALDYLHQKDPFKIHRDIKPDNILLDSSRHIMLIDFGLARVWKKNEYSFIPVGTASYMAPEQCLPIRIGQDGRAKYLKTPASDIYSAAMTFIALILGEIEAHREFVNNELLDNQHRQALLNGGKGFIGHTGGLKDNERQLLERAIGASINQADIIKSPASCQDAAFAITHLLQRMLSPDDEARPTAAVIRAQEIPLIDIILRQPRQQRLKSYQIKAEHHGKVAKGHYLAVTVQLNGSCGMTDDGEWLQFSHDGKVLKHWRVNAKGDPIADIAVLAEGQHHLHFYVDVGNLQNHFAVKALISELPDSEKVLNCQRVVSFATLWQQGDYEKALFNEFRVAEFNDYLGQKSSKEIQALQPFLKRLLVAYPEQSQVIANYLKNKKADNAPIFISQLSANRALKQTLFTVIAIVILAGIALLIFGSDDSKITVPDAKITIDNAEDKKDDKDDKPALSLADEEPEKEMPSIEQASIVLNQWNNNQNISAGKLSDAINTLTKYADETEDAVACGWLAYYFDKTQEIVKALKYHSCVAKKGNKPAKIWLMATVMLNATKPDGGHADINRYYNEARQYAETLAANGDIQAMYYYGRILYDVDNIEDEGRLWLEHAAELGSEKAKNRLAQLGIR